MDPLHTYTPSFPRADQMHFWPPHNVPNHMHMNPPPQPPVSYDYPPWHCNFGYPMICQNCGSNSFSPPNYSWRPPYSYNYSYSFPVPPQYAPPQSYQPWYDYHQGKGAREDNHCCGCPNHLCSEKESGVKIEEEGESNRDLKKIDSLIPYQLQNWPFPVAWNNPRDYYIKGAEPEKLGMNDLRNLGSSNQKNEDGVRNPRLLPKDGSDVQLPFPIFWMPYKPEEKEKNENIHHKMESTESKEGKEINKDGRAEQDIKVRQGVEHQKEKEMIPVKNVNSDGGKMHSTSKSKSPSPPVCLRVDPLPKKKGDKKIATQKPNEFNTSSDKSSPDKAVKSDDTTKSEAKKTKGTTKTIQVIDGSARDGEVKVDKITTKQHDKNLEVEKNPQGHFESFETLTKSEFKGPESDRVENDAEVMNLGDATKEEISKPRKRKFTTEEAAVVIQAAYRGFDVRRWEPFKKLKQIAEVREEIVEVKNLIQEMELSSDVRGNKQKRTIISENIMSLLLKLDTIQGLHPSIRDARKSVVRELVALQEKLDALANEQDSIDNNVAPPQEGNLSELPQNHVDGDSRSNDNLEVSDNGGVNELLSENENLGQVGPEPGTEISFKAITGEQDKECQIGEGDDDAVSVVAKNEDHEDLAIPQTLNLSSDQGKDLDQVKTDEISGLEMRVDARGEVDKGHVAVHQVSDDIINDELMPENATAYNSRPCEGADMNFVREDEEEEKSLHENAEGSSMPEGTTNESPVDNKFGDSKDLKDEDIMIGDSPNIIHETAGSIFASKETSEDKPEDVRNDSDTSLVRKEEDYVTGNSISNDVPSEVCEEAAAAKSHSISCDVRSEVHEEEQSNIISDDVPSQFCEEEEEEKNHSISGNEEEKSVEVDTAPVDISKTKKGDESYEKVLHNFEAETESEEKVSDHNTKLIEENEKLREMMEKLINSGQEQLSTISNLSCRIKDLEKKLSRKKRAVKMNRCGGQRHGSAKPLMAQPHHVD